MSNSNGTRDCLVFDNRPSTPPEIRKYRRSTNLEPGKRFQHHGLRDDYEKMNLNDKIYGKTDRGSHIGVGDTISYARPSELQRLNDIKAEKIYKNTNKEPLGHSPNKGTILPSKFTQGGQSFGIKSASSNEPAKNIIFPVALIEDSEKGNDLYRKSHGSYAPGEQKHRGYDWNIDPNTAVFGAKGKMIAFNGVSSNTSDVLHGRLDDLKTERTVNMKKVEDFKSMQDILGQSKNLGLGSASRPSDMVYGKAGPKSKIQAIEVIRGFYKEEDTLPDKDLGKSITPGFRNISYEDRAFGCPSIRRDIPAPDISRRSLADSQNYGDDVAAKDLVNPRPFADLAVAPDAMDEMRPKQKILELFARIGYNLDHNLADKLFYQASRGEEYTSINSFQNVLNQYLISQG